jgi:ribose 5-phosphate isomerase A
MGVAKAGPVVTDNDGFVLDADFGTIPAAAVAQLHAQIKALCGVVETGLFPGMADKAYFGRANGSVDVWTKPV